MIEKYNASDMDEYLSLRSSLWPNCSTGQHLDEMNEHLANPAKYAQFIARAESGKAIGFAEASVRSDYVNGTNSSPAAFLEGIFVEPRFRRCGIARKLLAEVTSWAESKGLTELASDALISNIASHAMHESLGFVETERVVYFCKQLTKAQI